MVFNWSTKELKTGPIEQYIATNNDVFPACCRCPPHTELPQQWRFREINASNEEYCRPPSVFDSFVMRRCYGIYFRWPQGNIRWVHTPLINLEIAYDNLEFQVVVRFQVVVQQGQANSALFSAEVMAASILGPTANVGGRVMPPRLFGLGAYRSLGHDVYWGCCNYTLEYLKQCNGQGIFIFRNQIDIQCHR